MFTKNSNHFQLLYFSLSGLHMYMCTCVCVRAHTHTYALLPSPLVKLMLSKLSLHSQQHSYKLTASHGGQVFWQQCFSSWKRKGTQFFCKHLLYTWTIDLGFWASFLVQCTRISEEEALRSPGNTGNACHFRELWIIGLPHFVVLITETNVSPSTFTLMQFSCASHQMFRYSRLKCNCGNIKRIRQRTPVSYGTLL
jgi:hypothetical protein